MIPSQYRRTRSRNGCLLGGLGIAEVGTLEKRASEERQAPRLTPSEYGEAEGRYDRSIPTPLNRECEQESVSKSENNNSNQ